MTRVAIHIQKTLSPPLFLISVTRTSCWTVGTTLWAQSAVQTLRNGPEHSRSIASRRKWIFYSAACDRKDPSTAQVSDNSSRGNCVWFWIFKIHKSDHVFYRRVNILQPHRIRSLSGTPRPFLTSRCFRKLLASHQHNLSGFPLQGYVATRRHHSPVDEYKQNVWMFLLMLAGISMRWVRASTGFCGIVAQLTKALLGSLLTHTSGCVTLAGLVRFTSLHYRSHIHVLLFVIVCRFLWAFRVYCERRSDHVSWCLQCNRPSRVSASKLATFLHVRTEKNTTINIT